MAATKTRIWRRILGVDRVVIEDVDIDRGDIVMSVRPWKTELRTCGRCGRRGCRLYDRGGRPGGCGRRRWRHLDCGVARVYVEADTRRVECPDCGPTVNSVPWARHNTGFTRPFDDYCAWAATEMSKKAACEMTRIAWRTIGAIIERVADEVRDRRDILDGLTVVGVDEISHKRGHNYMVVAVDHNTGKLVWAKEGRDKKTVAAFFDELGPSRSAEITAVTADGASWISTVVADRTDAVLCTDPFHVVGWANDAVDDIRKQIWNDARRNGFVDAAEIKGARWALVKNPENLTDRQKTRLADIAKRNKRLYRAYLLKEQLRLLLKSATLAEATPLLDAWLAWASRSKLDPFIELARKIRRHRTGIENSIRLKLSNGIVESTNTKIRVIMRRAYGFHSPDAIIALALLTLGGLRPPLPHANPAYRTQQNHPRMCQ